jgi:hypothetical protein
MKTVKDVDVFWWLEELLIKKDLDDNDWYRARTVSMIERHVNNLEDELVKIIMVAENVDETTAKKSVELFRKDMKREKKELGDEPFNVEESAGYE